MPGQGESIAHLERKGETLNYFEQGYRKIQILDRKIGTENFLKKVSSKKLTENEETTQQVRSTVE